MPNSDTVKEALKKQAAYGKDIDLEHYEERADDQIKVDDLESSDYKRYMENVGIVADEMDRSGTLMFIDNNPSHCSTKIVTNRAVSTKSMPFSSTLISVPARAPSAVPATQ